MSVSKTAFSVGTTGGSWDCWSVREKCCVVVEGLESLQKRAAKLDVLIKIAQASAGPVHVAVDSTGLKVYVEAE